ncbi:MAG: hypothetical protein J7545_05270 [Roseofilum sp. SBFL]|uniref:hypothetical protein n=1 Tax=unclassified Roseofilum TaxID=2620099 RepID=UPI001B18C092|nr:MULTISPECIES: hypothetical protein [unclassified Roseofilum]MBP0014986.1 hypothetical protein [Roseofilum sp. SID3]MBP0024574.1 hypothetical protein [Roseofilum sp. SID2]MBP0037270.1 hypothetical protein [Roseofilum sp. SID1]MBP0041373.1 hypothetical protein [Roseofilum sp. SBFL]
MRLQFKGWVFFHAIALTVGLGAIAHLEQPWHSTSDRNSLIENVNASPLKPTIQTPLSGKVWSTTLPL